VQVYVVHRPINIHRKECLSIKTLTSATCFGSIKLLSLQFGFYLRSHSREKGPTGFVMSVRPTIQMYQCSSHWADFHKIRYWGGGDLSRRSKFGENRAKKSGTLHERLRTFYCCWPDKFGMKAFFGAILNIFVELTVICSSLLHNDPFPL
jgi:hypothetical protein